MTTWTLRVNRCATAALIVMAGIAGCGGDDERSTDVSAATTQAVRNVVLLNQDWRFIQNDALTDTAALANDGSTWTSVSLPHTWNAQDAATLNATVNYKRGLGWYRLEFDHPGTGAGQWLQFDAASIVADVWLNGVKLGTHNGAFTAFRFDVTGKLMAGRNVLLVKTDNRSTTGSTNEVPPLSGDFNMSGGLYRKVSIITVPALAHFALDDLGSSGVYASTSAVAGGAATVNVRSRLKNDAPTAASYTVQASLLDASQTPVATTRKNVGLAAGAAVDATQDLLLDGAHLWQGVDDPYLYKLVVKLKDAAGGTVDKVVQDFGIRQTSFDPNRGFFLNGKPVVIRGANHHQDQLGKGWAISDADVDADLATMREMGATAVRLAHYPHSSHTYEEASRLGLIVWAENGFVGGATVAPTCNPNAADPSASFVANTVTQTREMVRQLYNQAAIAMWSIANEVTQNQANGCGAAPIGRDNVSGLLRTLNTLTKQEDPTRPTVLADINEEVAPPAFIPVGGITDLLGVNRYYQWYYGIYSDLSGHLDLMHAKYPNQPMGISEYGAGAALGDQTDNPLGALPGSLNVGVARLYQPEGYANYAHQTVYSVIASKSYLWGSFIWTMEDFGSGIRNEGDVLGVNTKGLVSFDRKTRKDPFYFYKANWSTEPVTYITGRRYSQRNYSVADVTVYSNADTVNLSVNGAAVASMSQAQCVVKACTFPNVALAVGTNVLTAQGVRGASATSDTVNWTLDADHAANVWIAAGQLVTGLKPSSNERYGSDNFFAGGTSMALLPLNRSGQDFTPLSGVAAADAAIYAGLRSGNFRYRIPVPNGAYNVTLAFYEPTKNTVAGTNVFDVSANGVRVLAGLDPVAVAGAYRTLFTRTFPVTVAGGVLGLDFIPTRGMALVSAIAVRKQ